MIRATITITGDVQVAGYWVVVRDTARKLGLVGFAENMPDGTVNVVCEGEKKKIETLVGSIKIKTETTNVEKIDVRFEDATGEFKGKGFVVKVGDLGDELFQGYATSLKYFRVGWNKQDTTIDVLKDFRDSTNQQFTDMGNRYGSIQDELVNTRKELAKLVEHIGVLVEEHIKKKEK